MKAVECRGELVTGREYRDSPGPDFICIKINFAYRCICCCCRCLLPSKSSFSIPHSLDFLFWFLLLLIYIFFLLLLLSFCLFAATASRVPWPSRRSSAAPTTEPTHHYADWIITIAYIRHPYGLPAKDSVPARVSFSHTHTRTHNQLELTRQPAA